MLGSSLAGLGRRLMNIAVEKGELLVAIVCSSRGDRQS